MKIRIAPYNPKWADQFALLKKELSEKLNELNPLIEHIGSTSVVGLGAKPVIDISLGIKDESSFDRVVELMKGYPYIYYEVYNSAMPNRRLFLRLKNETDKNLFPELFTADCIIPHDKINEYRLAHVHVWQYGSPDWDRHIAFREYLKSHPTIRKEYEDIKRKLSKQDWADGNEYNKGKDRFIKKTEADAILWYRNLNTK